MAEQPYIITRKALPKGTKCDTCPSVGKLHLDRISGHGPSFPIMKVVAMKVPQDITLGHRGNWGVDHHGRSELFVCDKCVDVLLGFIDYQMED
jgi:hypothetical protein